MMHALHDTAPSGVMPREGIGARIMDLFATQPVDASEVEAQIAAFAGDYLNVKRFSSDTGLHSLAQGFKESRVPEYPSSTPRYLDYLIDKVAVHAIRTSSPRFVGHMTSALPHFIHQLAKLLTVMNQNQVKTETSKAFSPYERQAIAMIHRLVYGLSDEFYEQHIQHRESTLGMIVSGGTIANITALWCARNAALGPCEGFAGVEQEGLAAALSFYGYRNAVVIGSELLHYSFDKAAGVLGIGTRNLIRIRTDADHHLDLAALQRTLAECRERRELVFAIIGIAGTTDCGAIDPLAEMAHIARATKTHFHVDAAWGGPLLFSARSRAKLAGIEEADSVTIDGHKQLYLPVGIGMVMLRNPRLAQTIEKQAQYIVRSGSVDLGKRALEGSRPAMALYLHAALQIISRRGYEFLIEESLHKTLRMAETVRSRPEFELLMNPEMNILLYRYVPELWRKVAGQGRLSAADNESINQFNVRLQKTQREAGHNFVSRTRLRHPQYAEQLPTVALRCVIANPLTTEADIDAVLSEQVKLAGELA